MINELKKWMTMFDQSGLGSPTSAPADSSGRMVPVSGVNNNAARVNWARDMMRQEAMQQPPDFFGGGRRMAYPGEGQYIQPQQMPEMDQQAMPQDRFAMRKKVNNYLAQFMNQG